VIAAPPRRVWAVVADIAGHAHWQVDVAAITFTSDRHRGVGTTYDVATRLGPVRMRIPMEIVEWHDGKAVGVRYEGTLSGGGRITVRRAGRGRSRVTWAARVTLPWWMGGAPGAIAAGRVLRLVWRQNLANLAALLEDR
jgi:carbon monoxide dehydrogenase subunit G